MVYPQAKQLLLLILKPAQLDKFHTRLLRVELASLGQGLQGKFYYRAEIADRFI